MSTNRIPTSRGLLGGLGVKILAGLVALADALGITQITPKSFQGLLDAFNTANSGFNAARSSRQSAYDAYHDAMKALTDWLKAAQNVLKGHFGARWNTMWAQAGFVNHSTAIPRRLQDRISLALNLVTFLTTNPSYQAPSLQVTPERGTAVRDGVINAQNTVQQKKTDDGSANQTLKTAQAALVNGIRLVISILSRILDKDDPRWETFGLNPPGMNTTPPQPTGLKATAMGTQVMLECDPTPLANRYRWRGRIVGMEDNYRLLASSVEPMATLTGVAAGETLELVVQPVNNGSQGKASEPIVFTMPLPEQPAVLEHASAPVTTTVAPESSPRVAADVNGKSNGEAESNGTLVTPGVR